jgi:hypothetical protein
MPKHSDLTFDQFMKATQHYGAVSPNFEPAITDAKNPVSVSEATEPSSPTEKKWALFYGDVRMQNKFYTKEEAKHFAEKKMHKSDVKWFKKDGWVYMKDERGVVLWKMREESV